MQHDPELTERLYSSLYLIRRVEQEIVRIYPTDKIKSPVHLSIGQESVSVGVCLALQPQDVVFGTYRGHAMYLAKGGDLKKMIAELYGKKTGCAQGKGGSMHLIDKDNGVMGTSAIVGTTIPISVGYAYALKFKRAKGIVVSFFGDGAVDEGAFHESMNFAALKALPALFVCENNSYAIHSHHLTRRCSDNVCDRAMEYGMPAESIEDGNVFKIFEVTGRLAGHIREGGGPAFLECSTCRWKEHVGPNDDFDLGYRSKADVAWWKDKDEVKRLRNLLDVNRIRHLEAEVERRIREAFQFAEQSPFPDRSALYHDLFAES